jgi:cAMP-dependent protein kinase regulator
MAATPQRLAELTKQLQDAPGDLGRWWALADGLAAAQRIEAAAQAMASLGEAAVELGRAALALGCACWLREHRPDLARPLVDRVAQTYAAGSTRIDRSSRPRPPAPPRGEGEAAAVVPPPVVPTIAEVVARAERAVAAATAAARQRFGGTLPPAALLQALSAEEVVELAGVMTLRRQHPGQVVIEVGQPATDLYWLAQGVVVVTRDGRQLGELRSGAVFGEIGLLTGTTRTARVTCVDDCWLLEVPARAVEALAGRAPHMAAVLAEYARSRLLANVMRSSEIFQRLDELERKSLLPRFETVLAPAGHKLVEQGAAAERLHVLVSGRCQVRRAGELVATLGMGEVFGEASLLQRKPANADVVALENTVTLSLSRQHFNDVAVKHPELLAEVYKLLLDREHTGDVAPDAAPIAAADLII